MQTSVVTDLAILFGLAPHVHPQANAVVVSVGPHFRHWYTGKRSAFKSAERFLFLRQLDCRLGVGGSESFEMGIVSFCGIVEASSEFSRGEIACGDDLF